MDLNATSDDNDPAVLTTEAADWPIIVCSVPDLEWLIITPAEEREEDNGTVS